ncbi:hypothetical protein HID58_046135 [Brassica napus]|uniref:Uncharacterized protein n=5 Tax=Brassica TaxID=3705 RepID=A0ABQ8AVL9_BRANA|nr:hypothetical protein HID58_046135 [Brassica napus]CDY32912.1 BnaC02g11960D [Brassica napus]VDD21193.1 unnamed protein product [Brassica oleracea]
MGAQKILDAPDTAKVAGSAHVEQSHLSARSDYTAGASSNVISQSSKSEMILHSKPEVKLAPRQII